MSEYEMSVREKDKRGGQEKSFHSKARFRSTKDVAVLRIFRRKRQKIQVPTSLQGLFRRNLFSCPPRYPSPSLTFQRLY